MDKPAMRVSKIEIILIVLGFLGIGIFLATFAGGPIYSDELIYMNAGLNNLKIPYILNRYTHVFLQKPFLELAPSPLIGVKIYWSFLITLTAFLTYWCARLLTQSNHLLHGALAAILFLSMHFIIDYSGVTIVDFTAMLMVMAFLMIYIFAARNNFSRPWLIALGFVFFLAFKTKETTLTAAVVLIGLGFVDGKIFQFRSLWKNLLNFFYGILGGMLFFAILNGLLLHDPFFGLSPSSIKAFLDSYIATGLTMVNPSSQGWYTGSLTTIWLLPFILYVITGVKKNEEERINPTIRLIWLVPIVLVTFLTVMMFRRFYIVEPRFFFPALPVLCFLAPQLFIFEPPATSSTKVRFWIYLAITVLACVGINYALRPVTARLSWDFDGFLNIILYPLLLTILIGLAFCLKRYTYKTVLIPVACILLMTIYPIRTNIKYLAILHQNEAVVQNKFYPFSAFASQLKYSPDMQVYVSTSLWSELEMLSTERNEVMSMYNVYFDRHAVKENFTVSTSPENIAQDLHQGNYTYILMTPQDWQHITTDPVIQSWLEARYSYFEDSNKPVILLVRK